MHCPIRRQITSPLARQPRHKWDQQERKPTAGSAPFRRTDTPDPMRESKEGLAGVLSRGIAALRRANQRVGCDGAAGPEEKQSAESPIGSPAQALRPG